MISHRHIIVLAVHLTGLKNTWPDFKDLPTYAVTDTKDFSISNFYKSLQSKYRSENKSTVKLKWVREIYTYLFDTPEQWGKKRTALKYRKKMN